MSETKHFFAGQSQEYVTPQAKDQTQQDKPVIPNIWMGLDNSGKNKQAGKNGFNSQLGFEDFLFFTIKKPRQQTCSAYHDQNIHHVLLITYPQITQIFADFIELGDLVIRRLVRQSLWRISQINADYN